MRYKYLELVTKDNERVVFGKNSVNKESKFQLVKVEGTMKNATSIFKNETIDSQLRIFRGNRLSERQILVRIALQPKNSLTSDISNKWDKKEEDIIELINTLSTTDIQRDGDESTLILTSRSGRKFLIKKVIVESIDVVDSGKAYNNYVEIDLTIKAYDPYIYDGSGSKFVTLDLSSNSILTDFVNDGGVVSYDSRLEMNLETPVELFEEINVRDGYISNDGIFYNVDTYGEDITTTYNGQFWLADSLNETITNSGVRVYPKITIYGFTVNPRIENKSTGQIFELSGTINENERVEVDMEAKTAELVYLNVDGVEVRQDVRSLITQDSSWLYLQRGENEIETSFSEGSAESFKIEIEWETRYEGIGV